MIPKTRPHYVNNKDFGKALVEYVLAVNKAKAEETPIPVVTNYIASCFLKIGEGLSHKVNFIRYTYREEMVMDAVENCLRAITNYNPLAETRTGTPNAFAYFTQICYFAFLRRIEKEKKQQDIKWKFIEQSGIEEFIANVEGDNTHNEQAFIDSLRERIGRIKQKDAAIKEFVKKEKVNKSLELFMTDNLVKEYILENSYN
ncbi:hypothetical protein [Lake Baikal phage Baikal-20-5m-C28]|nr:hypothetical protein [Lake Baikal phage Baikal-20-5m-C28]